MISMCPLSSSFFFPVEAKPIETQAALQKRFINHTYLLSRFLGLGHMSLVLYIGA